MCSLYVMGVAWRGRRYCITFLVLQNITDSFSVQYYFIDHWVAPWLSVNAMVQILDALQILEGTCIKHHNVCVSSSFTMGNFLGSPILW